MSFTSLCIVCRYFSVFMRGASARIVPSRWWTLQGVSDKKTYLFISQLCSRTGAGQLRLQVRGARSGHGRHQTPVGREDRGRGPGPVQLGGTRRDDPHGRLHGRPGERFQRGGHQVRHRGARAAQEAAASSRGRPNRARRRHRRHHCRSGPGRPTLG